jgi:hypothetical protein
VVGSHSRSARSGVFLGRGEGKEGEGFLCFLFGYGTGTEE